MELTKLSEQDHHEYRIDVQPTTDVSAFIHCHKITYPQASEVNARRRTERDTVELAVFLTVCIRTLR
jgi:hypothetical protein